MARATQWLSQTPGADDINTPSTLSTWVDLEVSGDSQCQTISSLQYQDEVRDCNRDRLEGLSGFGST